MSNLKNNKEIFKEINNIAIPIMLSMLSGVTINIIDQAIVGRLSIDAFAGVNLVGSVINTLVGVLGIIAVAFNIIVCKNKSNKGNSTNYFFSVTIIISVFIGIVLFILLLFINNIILNKIFGLNGQALVEACSYMSIYSISIGLNMIIFTYSSVFKIFKCTKNILKVCIIVNVTNCFLDYVLVYGKLGFPKLGAIGAAIGSIVALILNIILYHFNAKKYVTLKKINIIKFKKYSRELINISLPLMTQEFFEEMMFIYGINMIITRIGTLQLSTYELLLTVLEFVLMPMFAYSSTIVTLISESNSLRDYKKCKKINNITIITVLSIYFITVLFIITTGKFIPSLITDNEQLINSYFKFIFICLLVQIFNIISNIYKANLQSIGYEKWVLKISSIINVITLIIMALIGFNVGLIAIYIIFGINYIILSLIYMNKCRKYYYNIK